MPYQFCMGHFCWKIIEINDKIGKGYQMASYYEVAYRRTRTSGIQKTTVTADSAEEAKAKVRRQNSSSKELEIYDARRK